MELVRIYIILIYADNLEVYTPIFLVGFSFIIIMLGGEGVLGKMVLLGFWPGYVVYVSWISGMLQGIKLIESVKKVVVLLTVSTLVVSFNALLLIVILGFSIRGLIGVTTLGIYVRFSILSGLIILLFIYTSFRILINVNYKILIIGILPLPVFFVKVFGFWRLYIVLLMGIMVFLE